MLFLLPGQAFIDFSKENRRFTVCGTITKTDGTVLRCTQFDDDITITSGPLIGTYLSTAAVTASDVVAKADLSVDNLEMTGVFANTKISDAFGFTGFTLDDVVGGLFRGAKFKMFICQWDNPSVWQKVIQSGTLGQISRDSEGTFTAEWRGLAQALQQNIGRVYSELCDVKDFCDSRCKLHLSDYSFLLTVGGVNPFNTRRSFEFSIAGTETFPGAFDLGRVTMTTGANEGYVRQIKRENDGSGYMELWEDFPEDLAPGDTGIVIQGCDRRFETCKDKYNNVVNFRGHGLWIPGLPKIIRAP